VARYMLLFAGAHLSIAISFGLLLDALGWETGKGLGVGLVFAAATIVGWRFVKKHKRHFTSREKWQLIGGSLIYLLLFDALVVWGMLDAYLKLTAKWWIGVVGFGVALDFVAIWMSYQHAVRYMMQKQLERLPK
jgi:ABC-type uncharacterized transport system permease subunit